MCLLRMETILRATGGHQGARCLHWLVVRQCLLRPEAMHPGMGGHLGAGYVHWDRKRRMEMPKVK